MTFVDGTNGGFLDIELHIAPGADITADPLTWSWSTNITAYGLNRAGVHIRGGRADEQTETESVALDLELFNANGLFSPRNPMSTLYPYMRQSTPIRVRLRPDGVTWYEFVGLTSSVPPRWDASGRDQWVSVTAYGTLKRIMVADAPVNSDLYNEIIGQVGLVDYWSLEDGTLATIAASALPGGAPMVVVGTAIDFATDEGPVGSLPLPTHMHVIGSELKSAGRMKGTTSWGVSFVFKLSFPDTGSIGGGPLLSWEVPGHSLWQRHSLRLGVEPGGIVLQGEPYGGGVATDLTSTADPTTDEWHHVLIWCEQIGGNIVSRIWLDGVASGTAPDTRAGNNGTDGPHNVTISPSYNDFVWADIALPFVGLGVGHLGTYSGFGGEPPEDVALRQALAMGGHSGESAQLRFDRACRRAGLTPDRTYPPILDGFERTAVSSWGSTRDGAYAWSTFGAGGVVSGADVNVAGFRGTHSVPATVAYRATYLSALSLLNTDVRVRLPYGALPTNITGGALEPANIMLRGQSITRYYLCRLSVETTEIVNISIHDIGGAGQLGSATVPGLIYDGQPLIVRAQVNGSTIRMKVWRESEISEFEIGGKYGVLASEPPYWHLTITDTAIATAGWVGLRSGVAASNSNGLPRVFPYETFSVDAVDYMMGPRLPMDDVADLRECEATAAGVMYELPNGRLRLDTARDRYDLPVTLTLDYAAGHVSPSLEPIEDDQLTRNDVRVSRPGGASARFALTSGPMSTLPAYPGVGRRPGTGEANPSDEQALIAYAGYAVARGTVDEERYPRVHVDCHANPSLVAAAMAAARPSRRIQITNPPNAQGFFNVADQLVEGFEIYIDFFSLDVWYTCTPYAPYRGFGLVDAAGAPNAGEMAGWLVPETCTTTGPLTTTATAVPVLSDTAWATDASNYPVDITVNGEVMRVTACTGATTAQTLTVTRSINGVVKTHLTGRDVYILAPGMLTMET